MWKWGNTNGRHAGEKYVAQEQDGEPRARVGLENCREARMSQAQASTVVRDVRSL